jgi:hypothetical protein
MAKFKKGDIVRVRERVYDPAIFRLRGKLAKIRLYQGDYCIDHHKAKYSNLYTIEPATEVGLIEDVDECSLEAADVVSQLGAIGVEPSQED